MTRNAKRALSLIFAVIMLSMTLFSLPASAYGNGGTSVYNGSTKLGTGDIWTNNKSKTASGKILYGELDTTTTGSGYSLYIKVGYTVVDGKRATDNDTIWQINTASHGAGVVSTNISVDDDVIPVDARGFFVVGYHIGRVCKRYNFGDGVKTCSDGDDCVYLDE